MSDEAAYLLACRQIDNAIRRGWNPFDEEVAPMVLDTPSAVSHAEADELKQARTARLKAAQKKRREEVTLFTEHSQGTT